MVKLENTRRNLTQKGTRAQTLGEQSRVLLTWQSLASTDKHWEV